MTNQTANISETTIGNLIRMIEEQAAAKIAANEYAQQEVADWERAERILTQLSLSNLTSNPIGDDNEEVEDDDKEGINPVVKYGMQPLSHKLYADSNCGNDKTYADLRDAIDTNRRFARLHRKLSQIYDVCSSSSQTDQQLLAFFSAPRWVEAWSIEAK